MVALPATTPVIMPEAEPTVATAVLPELHIPPVLASFKVIAEPTHIAGVPVIDPALARGLTVTVAVVVAVPQTFVTA